MKQPIEYFQGAATVTARFSHSLKGRRREDVISKAARGICPKGISKADFEKAVADAEKRIKARK